MNKRSTYPAVAMVVFSMLFMACARKDADTVLTKQQVAAMADSIVATKTADIRREAAEDLDRRKSIEVKAIADSIVEAWQTGKMKDSAK